MMIRFFLLLTLVALAPVTAAEESSEADFALTEIWNCFDRADYDKENAVVSLGWLQDEGLPKGQGLGMVIVAGQELVAMFNIEGFNRRWSFGPVDEDGATDYAFIINPGGDGMYYDFTLSADGTASPSQRYKCEQV